MAMERHSQHLEEIFRAVFFAEYNTVLIGGAAEPLYQPADEQCPQHRIFYRDDYFSSALHEVAHWCVAGQARRQLLDFGYWYNPDGRNADEQRAFEIVEVKPQAFEWIFSVAAGIDFRPSADNLSANDAEAVGPSRHFLDALEKKTLDYCNEGLPERAAAFTAALSDFYGNDSCDNTDALDLGHYRGYFSR